MDVIKWLGVHLFEGWTFSFEIAAIRSNIELLEWLRAHGDVRTSVVEAGIEAAGGGTGNIEVLEWLLSHYPDLVHGAVDILRENALRADNQFVYEWLGLV